MAQDQGAGPGRRTDVPGVLRERAEDGVDGRRPHRAQGKGRTDDKNKNLQALCHSCHSRKTAEEDGRWQGVRRGSSGSIASCRLTPRS